MAVLPATDVFLVPTEDNYLVYAPLVGRLARVNAAAASQLGDYLRTGDEDAVDASYGFPWGVLIG